MKYNLYQIGPKIKYLRNKNCLTQIDLAKKLEIDRSTLSDYERSSAIPNTETIVKLCEIFEVSSDYLLSLSSLTKSEKEIEDITINPDDYLYVENLNAKQYKSIKEIIKLFQEKNQEE